MFVVERCAPPPAPCRPVVAFGMDGFDAALGLLQLEQDEAAPPAALEDAAVEVAVAVLGQPPPRLPVVYDQRSPALMQRARDAQAIARLQRQNQQLEGKLQTLSQRRPVRPQHTRTLG